MYIKDNYFRTLNELTFANVSETTNLMNTCENNFYSSNTA